MKNDYQEVINPNLVMGFINLYSFLLNESGWVDEPLEHLDFKLITVLEW